MKTILYHLTQNLSKRLVGNLYKKAGLFAYQFGRNLAGKDLIEDRLVPSLRALTHQTFQPKIKSAAFIAPNAAVIGQVQLGDQTSIWYSSTLRGDKGSIKVGASSIIQDKVTIDPQGNTTVIGDKVIIGPNSFISSCIIESNSFIGMGSYVGKNCIVKSGAIVAAGTVLQEGQVVEKNQIFVGNPGRLLRQVRGQQKKVWRQLSEQLSQLARIHDQESQLSIYKMIQRNQKFQQQHVRQSQNQLQDDYQTIQNLSKGGVPITSEDRQYFDSRFQMKFNDISNLISWKKIYNPYQQDTTILSDNYKSRKPSARESQGFQRIQKETGSTRQLHEKFF